MAAASRATEKHREIEQANRVARERHDRLSAQAGVKPPHVALAPPLAQPPFAEQVRWARFKPVGATRPPASEAFQILCSSDGSASIHFDGETRRCADAWRAAEWILSVADLPSGWSAALGWELRARPHWTLHRVDVLEWSEGRT